MPGTRPRLSERLTCWRSSRISSPSSRSTDAGISSVDSGERVAVTTTVSTCAPADVAAASATTPSLFRIYARLAGNGKNRLPRGLCLLQRRGMGASRPGPARQAAAGRLCPLSAAHVDRFQPERPEDDELRGLPDP